MKKKTLMCIPVALILSMAIITIGSASIEAPWITVSVSPEETVRQIGIGDTVWINVTVDNVTMVQVDVWAMGLEWDPSVLSPTSLDVGDFFVNASYGLTPPSWDDESQWTRVGDMIQVGGVEIINITKGELLPIMLGITSGSANGTGTMLKTGFQVLRYGSTYINITYPSFSLDPDGDGFSSEFIPAVVNGTATLTSTFITSIIVNSVNYSVAIDSNSTIVPTSVNCDNLTRTISFNVTCPAGTRYCNITIPNAVVQDLWQNSYTVLVDGQPIVPNNWTDGTNTHLDFTYAQSTHEIAIVPEFPWALMLPLLMIITMVAAVLRKNAWSRKPRGPVVAG